MPSFFLPNVCLHFPFQMPTYIYRFPRKRGKFWTFECCNWRHVRHLLTSYLVHDTLLSFLSLCHLLPASNILIKEAFQFPPPQKKIFASVFIWFFCRRMHCRTKTPHTGQWHLSKWQVVQGQLKAQLVKAHLCHWRPCFKSLSCHQWADI